MEQRAESAAKGVDVASHWIGVRFSKRTFAFDAETLSFPQDVASGTWQAPALFRSRALVLVRKTACVLHVFRRSPVQVSAECSGKQRSVLDFLRLPKRAQLHWSYEDPGIVQRRFRISKYFQARRSLQESALTFITLRNVPFPLKPEPI